MEGNSNLSVFMIPGMTINVGMEVDSSDGSRGLGVFVYGYDTIAFAGKTLALVNGWAQIDDQVGTIEAVSDSTKILYTHNRPEKNVLYFFAATGEVGVVNIVAVPIHDHSSIVQGGPAYGTYFSDDEAIS